MLAGRGGLGRFHNPVWSVLTLTVLEVRVSDSVQGWVAVSSFWTSVSLKCREILETLGNLLENLGKFFFQKILGNLLEDHFQCPSTLWINRKWSFKISILFFDKPKISHKFHGNSSHFPHTSINGIVPTYLFNTLTEHNIDTTLSIVYALTEYKPEMVNKNW